MQALLVLSTAVLAVAQRADDAAAAFRWHRWEQRTLACSNASRALDCRLLAPNSKVLGDTAAFKCHLEPMPTAAWNQLPEASTRLACPIGCAPDADLSVIQKVPYHNPKCVKYFTYGKYRDSHKNEWYLWMTAPCAPESLTTHCRFKDVPLKPAQRLRHKLA